MPPWFADPQVGRFRDEGRLSSSELDTILRWVDAGAPPGESSDRAEAVTVGASSDAAEWHIGSPDLVVTMPEAFEVPAEGVVEYVYLRMPTGLREDRWIRAIEVQPGERGVVHHIDVLVCAEGCRGEPRLAALEPGVPTILPGSPITEQPEASDEAWVEGEEMEFLTSFLPGGSPSTLPDGYARLLPAGAEIVLNVHYAPNGVAVADRSRVGFVFSEPPERRVISYFLDNYTLWIPAGAASYEIASTARLAQRAELLALTPHMHFRGTGAEIELLDRRGGSEPLLRVPRYDFDWQLTYVLAEPRVLHPGDALRYVLRYDNSVDNPANPDPQRDVPWGRQTSDEMASVFVTVAVPTGVSPGEVFAERNDC
jgi:hypothetical protein